MHRLFAALRPPAHVRRALEAAMLGGEGWRWQTEEQLHLTLAFLGEVPPLLARALAETVESFAFSPVDLRLAGPGVFEGRRRGSVGALWVGVEPRAVLESLATKLARRFEAAGARPERRRFVPHVTLARAVGQSRPAEAARTFLEGWSVPPLQWTADRVWLVESRLSPEGAAYTPVVGSRTLAP